MVFSRVDPIPASKHSTSPPVVRSDPGVRRTARFVGVLFLAGFLRYGVGNLVATGIVDSGDRSDSTRTGLVPRWLALWGFIGYACFAVGNLLELFGIAGAGLVGAGFEHRAQPI
jgi:hypothetical protein